MMYWTTLLIFQESEAVVEVSSENVPFLRAVSSRIQPELYARVLISLNIQYTRYFSISERN